MAEPKEWKPVLREAFHPPHAQDELALVELGVPFHEQRSFEKQVPSWRWPLWGVAIEEIVGKEGSGWKRGKTIGLYGERPPVFAPVDVALGKTRMVSGELAGVVSYKDAKGNPQKFVMVVEPQFKTVKVALMGKADQTQDAERLFSEIAKWTAEHNFYKGQKIDATGKFLDLSDIEEADLILAEKTKHDIFFNVKTMVERWSDYAQYGIAAKRGVILSGPPGCGKSMSLKVLAKSLPCTFVWATPMHVMKADGFVDIYDLARELAPTVVLLEDVDVYGLDRRLAGTNPLLGDLLNSMDGLVENKGVVTIASSNYAEVLDTALTNRPGRFDVRVAVGYPGPKEAEAIIRRSLEKRKVAFKGDPGEIVKLSGALSNVSASGAHVAEAVNFAMMLAVERGRGRGGRLSVDATDLQDAVQRIVADLGQNDATEKSIVQENVLKWGNWAKDLWKSRR
jgi:AAA+ superfamily predicted ATPase